VLRIFPSAFQEQKFFGAFLKKEQVLSVGA
jgi:hypothetical protein